MNTLNLSIRQGVVPFECQTANMDFRQVRANDEVWFWTASGCYRFLIADAGRRLGQLWRNDEPEGEAICLGAIALEDGECRLEPEAIMTGAQALFLIAVTGRSRHILSSPITKMFIIRQTTQSLT